MRHRLSAPLLLLSAVASIAAAQNPPATSAPATTPHITVTTHLVTIDVVVRAHDQPVRGLNRDDFTVLEDGHPQTLNFFEPHTAADNAAPATSPRVPSLPPDTYTNLPVTQVADSVTVLLLDGLNTEAADQLFVRREMVRYLKELPPGRHIAVFTLGTQLRLLQGFTDDVSLLLAALDRKEAATPSTMTIPKSQIADERNALDWMAETGASPMLVDSYTNFVNKSDANETNQRIALTVEAMEQLARYLAGIPGRKNLVWFSGSFPLQFFATERNPFHSDNHGQAVPIRDANDVLRSAVDLLVAARVAVYPVDARGVLLANMFGAEQQGDYARTINGAALHDPSQDTAMLAAQRVAEHGTMDVLAKETGGRAVYDDNGFKEGMANAVTDGSNFYTLAYTPTNHKYDGRLRHIEIRLASSAVHPKTQLYYRRSYYADDAPAHEERGPSGQRLIFGAAMGRGVPAATQIVFEARVVPADPQPASIPIAQHKPPLKGPLTRYDIDYAIGPRALDLGPLPRGERHGEIVIAATAWSADGKALTGNVLTRSFTLTAAQYRESGESGLQFHQTLDIPSGPVFLRLGVYDPASGHMGTLEIPCPSGLTKTAPLQ
ncbi:MAG TPA: VWA domain-containing protein [Edaphobacter sp.]|jgi:VWFA-related protein|nr:VWA domain-containing protein [Edaphobacter sp.]